MRKPNPFLSITLHGIRFGICLFGFLTLSKRIRFRK